MKLDVLKEARKVWKEISMEGVVEGSDLDTEMPRHLLEFFHIGKYYIYLFDVMNARFSFISPEISSVTGYNADEYDLEFHFSKVHPEDLPIILDFENAAVNFFKDIPNEKITKYKFSYDFRIMHADGHYIRLHQQVSTHRFNPAQRLLITFCVHTDITDLKKDSRPILSFVGLDGEPSYINVDVTKKYSGAKQMITRREREILQLLLAGHQSSEIAQMLHISKFTVDTHRKHLLAKTNCKSSMELAAKIVREGWV